MWNEGEKAERYDWHEGSIVCPPAGTWHQHYNTGSEPCRFIAFHASTAVQREEGGIEQIPFEAEDPALREEYVQECGKHAVTVAMD
jgi:gentisate 1,2-dioxygenase